MVRYAARREHARLCCPESAVVARNKQTFSDYNWPALRVSKSAPGLLPSDILQTLRFYAFDIMK